MTSGFVHNRLPVTLITWLFVFCIQSVFSQNTALESNDIDFYFNQTRIYQNQHNIDLALESLDKAAALAEKSENEKGLVDCYHKFAKLYLDLDKRETTIFYWDRAKVLLNELEYPYGHAVHKLIEAKLLYHSGNNFQAG